MIKSKDEIQKPHDIIASATNADSPLRIDPRSLELALAAREVFCWILGHPGGAELDNRIAMIEQGFEEAGFSLELDSVLSDDTIH